MSSPIEVWLWLLMVMGSHNPKTIEILEQYKFNATDTAKAIRDGDIPNLSAEELMRSKIIRTGEVKSVMQKCAYHNIRIVTLDDEEYPELLKNIYNPPIVLFVAGTLKNLDNEFSISVVGTRHSTPYGIQATDYIVSPLSRLGIVIVSGLANGLDSAAHIACLNNKGRTIGVAACGLLVDYPKGSGFLKRRILENGGAIISELLPDTQTSAEYFKHRNRIISGLSQGTLVVEAGSKSGCFLTVTHALEQGREVFAVPPFNIMNSAINGTAKLIRDGATPVFSYEDIVYAFYKDGGLEKYLK